MATVSCADPDPNPMQAIEPRPIWARVGPIGRPQRSLAAGRPPRPPDAGRRSPEPSRSGGDCRLPSGPAGCTGPDRTRPCVAAGGWEESESGRKRVREREREREREERQEGTDRERRETERKIERRAKALRGEIDHKGEERRAYKTNINGDCIYIQESISKNCQRRLQLQVEAYH